MSKKIHQKLIPLGKVVKPHGIKGELKLFLYNKDSSILLNDINIWINLDSKIISYKLEYILPFKGTGTKIIKLEKVDTRDKAKLISNKEFFISRKDFPNVEPGNFYINDIINFKVLEGNKSFGYICDIFSLPGGNVMGINFDGKEILIPMIDKYIKFFDFKKKVVILKDIKEFIKL